MHTSRISVPNMNIRAPPDKKRFPTAEPPHRKWCATIEGSGMQCMSLAM